MGGSQQDGSQGRKEAQGYGRAWHLYAAAGWEGVLPLERGKKGPPPVGFTGVDAAMPTERQMVAWEVAHPDGNLALRLPRDVVGIDVDDYAAKHGGATLEALEAVAGPLPPTWVSTAREGVSGIRFYRVEPREGWVSPGVDIDAISWGHRYAVVWPSVHPSGAPYLWRDHLGGGWREPPSPADLPMLPPAWVALMASDRPRDAKAEGADLRAFLDSLVRGEPCTRTRAARDALLAVVDEPEGSRHSSMNTRVLDLVRQGDLGHVGVELALGEALTAWVNAITADRSRTGQEATAEFSRSVDGAVAIVVGAPEGGVCMCEDGPLGPPRGPGPVVGAEEPSTPRPPKGRGDRFFNKAGLKAVTLAEATLELGPLAAGGDGRLWVYEAGVYTPDVGQVQARVAGLMGERYRRSHVENARDVVRTRVPFIDAGPVPEVMNFTNGLLDWRSGVLRPHDPLVLSTCQLAVPWRPGTLGGRVEAFLRQVVPADAVDLMWEVIGYLMYSGNPLHLAFLLLGAGRNGKGTFLRMVKALIGEANTSAVTLSELTGNRFAAATLYGRLANIAGDIDATYLESTARFKAVTGDDLIQAEHKYGQAFRFTPWASQVFSANAIPPSADVSTGYLDRWVVLPFPNYFGDAPALGLDAHLSAPGELEAAAVRAVAGLRALMERGKFDLPASLRVAKEEFAKAIDQVREWAGEHLRESEAAWTPRFQLHGNYEMWAETSGHKPLGAANFYRRLEALGHPQTQRKGVRGFRGIEPSHLRVVE